MDSAFGVTGKDWVILASDSTCVVSGILVQKSDEDKLYPIGDDKLLVCQGDDADRVHFCEFVQRNMALSALRDSHKHTAHSVACFARNHLSESLRKQPYNVNTLIAGVTEIPKMEINYPIIKDITDNGEEDVEIVNDDNDDDDDEGCASLYRVDGYGSLQKLRYGAHGYGAYFTLGLMDRKWKKDMTFEEGLELIKACIWECQTRSVLHCPKFIVKAIRKGQGIVPIEVPPLPHAIPSYRPYN